MGARASEVYDPAVEVGIPPLRHGDHLTREEFERRYEAMPHLKKAELIEGVVYMPSPVHAERHARPHGAITGWLFVYRVSTRGTILFDNATLRLPSNYAEVQPDAMLMMVSGGAARLSSDDYVEGPPELVVEVAASSGSYDAGIKRQLYERSGVREYLLWRTADERVDWWELQGGSYVALPANEQGIIASRVFPGLWLDVPALLADDMPRVLATLQQGIASPEHAAFVERLNAENQKDC
jgi:Uma2 family endonuclease